MGLRFSLDTSCVLNLLNPEEALDDHLVELLRLAMVNEVSLYVTEVYQGEVQGVEGRRAEIVKRARFLPLMEVPDDREQERDSLAQQFFDILWPNSPGDTKMADHGRRDCLHLASHVMIGGTAFVTRDVRLREKVEKRSIEPSITVLSPEGAVAAVAAARPKPAVFVTTSVAVRRATQQDRAALESLLAPLRPDYPDFEGWLTKTLGDAATVVNIGVMEGSRTEGVAIWKLKDARTAKLSTFYLPPGARTMGLGQHLLFHCLRQWIEKRIERAYVTVGADKEDMIGFCLTFGFRIEGAALRRYNSGQTEVVLTKHLVYRTLSENDVDAWLTEIATTTFSVNPATPALSEPNWFLPPRSLQRTAAWTDDRRAVTFAGSSSADTFTKTIPELEELFYPVRLAVPERAAYVVPIQPQWAASMMTTNPRQTTLFTFVDKLMLRLDNAYYCAPVYADDELRGSPILFYVSAPESSLTGVARVIERVIAEPEDLYLRFAKMGIYKLENIKGHVAKRGVNQGCAMAMHFGWWVPFPDPVPLKKAVAAGILNGHPQRVLRIEYPKFERALQEGGMDW